MFRKLGDWLRNFMLGRYGHDKLNVHLMILGIVLMVLGMVLGRVFWWSSILSLLSYVPLIWSIFRMYSRNIPARQRENKAYRNFWAHLGDRAHRYYRCPRCRQSVRVPRGKGKISIRCPKCSEKFIKRT